MLLGVLLMVHAHGCSSQILTPDEAPSTHHAARSGTRITTWHGRWVRRAAQAAASAAAISSAQARISSQSRKSPSGARTTRVIRRSPKPSSARPSLPAKSEWPAAEEPDGTLRQHFAVRAQELAGRRLPAPHIDGAADDECVVAARVIHCRGLQEFGVQAARVQLVTNRHADLKRAAVLARCGDQNRHRAVLPLCGATRLTLE